MKYLLVMIGCVLAMAVVKSAYAHADLIRSDPPANAVLDESPQEIHLWFTERLEPRFSHIELRNAEGITLEMPDAEVVGADNMELVLRPGELADGSYIIAWQVVSAADGHRTQGAILIAIGEPTAGFAPQVEDKAAIPADNTFLRWLNLISLAIPI